MEARAVVEVLDALERAGIPYRVDGGWGIDALLERQTRTHSDLDLVIARADLARARASLAPLGFLPVPGASPGLPARFVLVSRERGQVDLHLVDYDADGNGWQALGVRAWGAYPAAELQATGRIAERRVACVSAELQLRHHLGYGWTENDERDMRALAACFGLPLPPV